MAKMNLTPTHGLPLDAPSNKVDDICGSRAIVEIQPPLSLDPKLIALRFRKEDIRLRGTS